MVPAFRAVPQATAADPQRQARPQGPAGAGRQPSNKANTWRRAAPWKQSLAAIWQDVLAIDNVGLEDNFFELGGDSIVSMQVVSRARQAGIVLSPADLFQHQTIRGPGRWRA